MSTQLIKLSRISGAIALFLGVAHEAYAFWFIADIMHLHPSWQGLFYTCTWQPDWPVFWLAE